MFQSLSSCKTFVACYLHQRILLNHRDLTNSCLGYHPLCHGNGSLGAKTFLSDILTLPWGDHMYRLAK